MLFRILTDVIPGSTAAIAGVLPKVSRLSTEPETGIHPLSS